MVLSIVLSEARVDKKEEEKELTERIVNTSDDNLERFSILTNYEPRSHLNANLATNA